MASDLSSGCAEVVEGLDEKEEGEISLEDVSSSEEGHVSYAYGVRKPQASSCLSCSSKQHCAPWCTNVTKHYSKLPSRRDAVQGKENRHHTEETGYPTSKYSATTLQEKNDDLVPISSDSDMEIIGLGDVTKDALVGSFRRSRIRKKKKRRKSRSPALIVNNLVASAVDPTIIEPKDSLKQDANVVKGSHSSRSYHREMSPVYRSSRAHIVKRSPVKRYRISPNRGRSPINRSRSPVLRARSPIIRKSPRSARSPRRSPYRSPLLTMRRKMQRLRPSPPSRALEDSHGSLTQLLKKVRDFKETIAPQSLETSIKRNKEHASSLKEKLSNMLKNMSDNNGNITNTSTEKSSSVKKSGNDVEDEEDLALLRQKALETKQSKASKCHEQAQTESEKKTSNYIDDDHDEEDLKLRMIALRSAVLKKHQERVQRRIKSGKSKKSVIFRSESPFTDNFLDSIPIPSEDRLSPPQTPPSQDENNHAEDMELDTDVEREKEKLPYSPTDKITTNMPTDTELLGLQASDVSFVSASEGDKGYTFSAKYTRDEHNILQGNVCHENNYLSNRLCYTNTNNSQCRIDNADAPYSPSDSIEANIPNEPKGISCVPLSQLLEASIRGCEEKDMYNNVKNYAGVDSRQDVPYSTIAPPTYNSNLSQIYPLVNTFGLNSSYSEYSLEEERLPPRDQLPTESKDNTCKQHTARTNSQSNVSENDAHVDSVSEDTDVVSLNPIVGSAISSPLRSISPNGSLMTIDDITETDIDTSPTPLVSMDSQTTSEYVSTASSEMKDEPLYMRGVPDITKDANKIPTLINRSLVPTRVLHSNKHLQQQFRTKRPEIQPQATFKSAEMQPVNRDLQTNMRTNIPFKPMTLVQPVKKPQSSVPLAFHDDSGKDLAQNDNVKVSNSNDCGRTSDQVSVEETRDTPAHAETRMVNKRRKRNRKRSTIRNDNTAQLPENESNTSHTNESTDEHKSADVAAVGLSHRNTALREKSALTTEVTKNGSNQKWLQDNKIHRDKENKGLTASAGGKNVDENNRSKSSEDAKESESRSDLPQEKENIEHLRKKAKFASDGAEKAERKDETKRVDDRRPSVDEDEEELRALLLASLSKRSKSTDSVTSNTLSVSVTSVSDTNTTASIPKVLTQSRVSANESLFVATTSRPDQTTVTTVSQEDKICLNSTIVPNLEITKEIYPNVTVEVPVNENPAAFPRKRTVTTSRSPVKKIVRKVSVPASTKVVNNAKRYQNTIVQRKLNLQRAASLYNAQRQGKSLSSIKVSENKWSSSGKVTRASDTQRIVINLDSDTESDSESEQQQNVRNNLMSTDKNFEKRQPVIPSTDFEKCVDQFLRDVRKKQESAAAKPASPTSTPKKSVSSVNTADNKQQPTLHTPSAVRHLPASRQEEYHRLKQQIIEREKLKLQRKAESGVSNNQTNSKPEASNTAQNKNSMKESVIPVQSQTQASSKTENGKCLNVQPIAGKVETKTDSSKIISMSHTSAVEKSPENVSKSNANNAVHQQIKSTANSDTQGANKTVQNDVDKATTKIFTTSNSATEKNILNNTSVEESAKTSSLIILTKDEVNRKCMKEQENRLESNQICTNKTTTSSRDKIEEDEICKNVAPVENSKSRSTEVINKESASSSKSSDLDSNQDVDSDASTVILSENRLEETATGNSDLDQTTLTMSQYLATQNSENSSKDSAACQNSSRNTDSPKSNSKDIWNTIRKDSAKELSALISLSQEEQKRCLMETEHKLVMKRYSILDDLAEMLGNLRQWDMERDLQTSLVAEVKKLREQLRIAEERLMEQSNRINNMTPKVVTVNEKINEGRRECYKLLQICSGLGTRVIGQDYKVPEAGATLLENRVKEVAMHTRQLSRKRVPCKDLSEINAPITPLHKILSTMQTESTQEPMHVDSTSPLDQTEETSTYSETDTDQNVTKSTDDTSSLRPEVTSTPCHRVNDRETETHDVTNTTDSISRTNPSSQQYDSNVRSCELLAASDSKERHSIRDAASQSSNLIAISDARPESPERNFNPQSSNLTAVCNSGSLNSNENLEIQSNNSDKESETGNQSSKQDLPQSSASSIAESRSQSEKHDPHPSNLQIRSDTESQSPEQDSNLQSCSTNTKSTSELEISKQNTIYPICSVNTQFTLKPLSAKQEHQPKKILTPYISILTHFKAPRNTNLNGILCPFELMGTCSDGDCQFVHQATSHDR